MSIVALKYCSLKFSHQYQPVFPYAYIPELSAGVAALRQADQALRFF